MCYFCWIIYPSIELLNRENGYFMVKHLSHNVTSILQSMDQGVITILKRIYRQKLLNLLLSFDINEAKMMNFIKQLNLKNLCYMISKAQNFVGQLSLKNAWNKLLKKTYENHCNEIIEANLEEISALVNNLKICDECNCSWYRGMTWTPFQWFGISNFIRQRNYGGT